MMLEQAVLSGVYRDTFLSIVVLQGELIRNVLGNCDHVSLCSVKKSERNIIKYANNKVFSKVFKPGCG